jgi:putative addiction module component (TIGR02574 family)
MSKDQILKAAMKLGAEDRRAIGERLIESVEQVDNALTAEQEADLRRRLEEHRRDPNPGSPWKDVKKRLLALSKRRMQKQR